MGIVNFYIRLRLKAVSEFFYPIFRQVVTREWKEFNTVYFRPKPRGSREKRRKGRQGIGWSKLVINETLAKALKLPVVDFKADMTPDRQMYELMESLSGEKPINPDFITFTKNKGECVFKANDPEHLSTIFKYALSMWKQHMMYLNEQENIILAEYRDAILPELLNGEISL